MLKFLIGITAAVGQQNGLFEMKGVLLLIRRVSVYYFMNRILLCACIKVNVFRLKFKSEICHFG